MILGRSAWDNMLLSLAVGWGIDMVDVTGEVNVFHHNFPARRIGLAYVDPNSGRGEEMAINQKFYTEIVRQRTHPVFKGSGSGTCNQSKWVYRNGRIVPR